MKKMIEIAEKIKDKCAHCIIGSFDFSRAPCHNCYDRAVKMDILKEADELFKSKGEHND